MTDQALSSRPHVLVPPAVAMPLAVAAGVYLLLVLMGHRLLNDTDTYWHIVVGQWIVQNQAFPRADMFSHTLPGAPWIAKEWLSQIILAGAYRVGGWTLVVILAAAAAAGTLGLLTRLLMDKLAPIPALGLSTAALVLVAGHTLARPHVLALPVMVAWVGGLIRAFDRRRPPSFALLPLMVLWANLHGGFTLGLALIAPIAAEAVWTADRSRRRQVAIAWGRFAALAACAACVTPYGPESILVTYRILGLGEALRIIGEWLPQDFSRITPFEVLLLMGLGFALSYRVTVPPLRLVVLLGLLHLALAHVRNGEILGLLGPLLIAAPLAQQFKRLAREPDEGVIATTRLAPGILIALCVLMGSATVARSALGPFTPRAEITPAAAVEAIKRARAGPVFNDYEFGGYLISAGVPPFIDGRTELYGGVFMARHHYAVALIDLPGFLQLLDQYRIGATLLAPSRPAVALLDRLSGWQRIHSDDIAVVHVRADAAAACAQVCTR